MMRTYSEPEWAATSVAGWEEAKRLKAQSEL
jgi:hypothetical protein